MNSTDRGGSDSEWSPDSILRLISLLAHRWVLEVLQALSEGPERPSALSRRLGVSHKSLTETLRHMMACGLVTRTVVAAVPAEVDYNLTPEAHALWPALKELHRWRRVAVRPERRPGEPGRWASPP
jgi:DNA-binding HxlR family transcriptional regulator